MTHRQLRHPLAPAKPRQPPTDIRQTVRNLIAALRKKDSRSVARQTKKLLSTSAERRRKIMAEELAALPPGDPIETIFREWRKLIEQETPPTFMATRLWTPFDEIMRQLEIQAHGWRAGR